MTEVKEWVQAGWQIVGLLLLAYLLALGIGTGWFQAKNSASRKRDLEMMDYAIKQYELKKKEVQHDK